MLRESVHDHVDANIDIEKPFDYPSRGRNTGKNSAANVKAGYARVLLMSISEGRMAATTSICIVSMPRLKARMPPTRSQRPKPSRSNVAAKARP
jgi:hypothetical protein